MKNKIEEEKKQIGINTSIFGKDMCQLQSACREFMRFTDKEHHLDCRKQLEQFLKRMFRVEHEDIQKLFKIIEMYELIKLIREDGVEQVLILDLEKIIFFEDGEIAQYNDMSYKIGLINKLETLKDVFDIERANELRTRYEEGENLGIW